VAVHLDAFVVFGPTVLSATAATLAAVRVTFLMLPTMPDTVAVGTMETRLRLARPRRPACVAIAFARAVAESRDR